MRTRYRKMDKGTIPEQRQWRQKWLEVVRQIPLRQALFWLHLVTGIVAGGVITVMSVTGVLLAFERQILTSAESQARTVQSPATGVPRLDLDAVVAQARALVHDGQPSGVTLRTEPTAATMVNFGRERVVFIDPYRGVVLSAGTHPWRSFFHSVTDWHRRLGREGQSRDVGRAITGACNAAFAVMVVTGVYLWWPRRWTRRALAAITVPAFALRGKARNWNWHHVAGFWSAAALLCITLTGVVMSYQWANDLLYTLTGNIPPPPRPPLALAGQRPGPQSHLREDGAPGSTPQRTSLQALFVAATRQAPHWRSLTMRLPQRGATEMTIMLEEAESLHPYPRSILTLDTATAAVLQWEPYGGYNLGRTLRAWVRPVHTGEAGGVIGQVVATLAAVGGVILVCTGFALTWRRVFGRNTGTNPRVPEVTPL